VDTRDVVVEPMSSDELSRKIGKIRKVTEPGGEIVVTFHGRPMARVVSDQRWQQLQNELAQLRAALADRGVELEEAVVA
jgi:prevent-host-death family protein